MTWPAPLLFLVCGLAMALGLLIGLSVRGGQVTQLAIGMEGLELTVEQQRVGLEGLGRVIQAERVTRSIPRD